MTTICSEQLHQVTGGWGWGRSEEYKDPYLRGWNEGFKKESGGRQLRGEAWEKANRAGQKRGRELLDGR